MFDNFDLRTTAIFKKAEKERSELAHPYVGSEHLLLSILSNKDELTDCLAKYDLTYNRFKKELISVVGSAHKNIDVNLYTPLLKKIIENALNNAKEDNDGVVTATHLFLAMLEEGEGIAIRLLISMDIDLEEIEVRLIPAKVAYDHYLNDRKLGFEFLPGECTFPEQFKSEIH